MKAVIVSDLHIGSPYFLHKDFQQFVKNIPEDHEFIMNGDIMDDPHKALKSQHQRTLELIAKMSNRNRVVWVRGNHDNGYVPKGLEKVRFKRFYSLKERLLIVHGDDFDEIMPRNQLFIKAFRIMHNVRVKLGAKPVHVAHYAKKWGFLYRVLRRNVMMNAVKCARENGYGAVTCGHTHYPEDKVFNDIRYVNTGAWTESPVFCLWVSDDEMTLILAS